MHTSDTVMRLDALPPRMAVIGGGFVACELAHVFSALGVAVTQVQRGPTLLRHHEVEVAQRYTDVARHHYDLRLSTTSTSAQRVGDVWRIGLDGPGGPSHVEAEVVLLAVGRVPNTDRLEPAAGGLDVHDDGRLVVDEQLRTTSPGVWALGDVSSAHQLKHVANHEARIVAHNLAVDLGRLAGEPRTTDDRPVPHAVFGHPQVAAFGPTAAELGEAGTPFVTATQAVGDVAYGWALEDTTGLLDDPRRPRRPDPRRTRHRAARVDPHPAAGAGGVVRAARHRRGPRAVLDPPGPGRGRRERPARPAVAGPGLTRHVPASPAERSGCGR